MDPFLGSVDRLGDWVGHLQGEGQKLFPNLPMLFVAPKLAAGRRQLLLLLCSMLAKSVRLTKAVNDASFFEIVWRHLEFHAVPV
jgi:hypothetical protein